MCDPDEVTDDEVGPQVSKLEKLIATFGALSRIIVVDLFFLKGLKVSVASIGGGDLGETFVRSSPDPKISIVCFLIDRFKTQLKKAIAFRIGPKVLAAGILE